MRPPEALDVWELEDWIGGAWDQRDEDDWEPEDGLEPTAYTIGGKLVGGLQCCARGAHGARCSKLARAGGGRHCVRHESTAVIAANAARKRKAIGAKKRRDAEPETPKLAKRRKPRRSGRHYHMIAKAVGHDRAERYAQALADQELLTDPHATLAFCDTLLEEVIEPALRYGDVPDWRIELRHRLESWERMPDDTDEQQAAKAAAWESFRELLDAGATSAEAIASVQRIESERATRNERIAALQLKMGEYIPRREFEAAMTVVTRTLFGRLATDTANALLDEIQRALTASASDEVVDTIAGMGGIRA